MLLGAERRCWYPVVVLIESDLLFKQLLQLELHHELLINQVGHVFILCVPLPSI
jgi:hypothetical protein